MTVCKENKTGTKATTVHGRQLGRTDRAERAIRQLRAHGYVVRQVSPGSVPAPTRGRDDARVTGE